MKRLYTAKYGYILMSVLFYIAGLAYMFLPEIPDLILCVMAGLTLLCYGAIKLVGYLAPDRYCLAFQYDMASAILLLALGVLTLVCNVRIRDMLTPGLGVLVLFDSVLTIQMAKDAAKFGLKSWVLLLVVAIITALLSMVLLIGPLPGVRFRHVISGIVILAEGLMKHCVVLCTVERRERRGA